MIDKKYFVYIHTNKINGKKYIGLTSQTNPNDRWHNGTNYIHNRHFNFSIQKYGWDSFKHEIVASNLTAKEASNLERELIAKYKTTDENYGYNLDSGGSRTTHSESTKEKIRQAITGIKRSDETKEKIRQASTGNKNCLGRKQTEEAKQKNREAHYNKTHIVTNDMKERIMLHTKTRKETLCVELNMIFPSVSAAARYLNGSQGTISSALRGERHTAYGYHWKYV